MKDSAAPTTRSPLFVTTDLALAAYLAVSRPLARVERQADGRVAFSFIDDAQLRADVSDYSAMGGAVAPLRYSQTLRIMKRLVHQATAQNRIEGKPPGQSDPGRGPKG
jgi:class 3 adenylate cyclase